MRDPDLVPVVRLAPAKLNLTLAVIARRDDGYHELHSVMATLALADRLSLAPSATRADTLHVTGADTGPAESDLVLRGIAEARRAAGAADPGDDPSSFAPGRPSAPALAARLEKRIPVAAGLAGGSSDAAAAMDGALEAWAIDLDVDARRAAALRLGSDVPFFLVGGFAAVAGHGDRVTPLPSPRGEPGVLLVTPAIAVSTGAVFAALDDGARQPDPGATRVSSVHLAQELGQGLDTHGLLVRAGVLAQANDLVLGAEVVAPGLRAFRRVLARRLGRPVGQSGSGPTCWALYASLDEATAAAAGLGRDLEAGTIEAPGDGRPFVAATTFTTREGGQP